MPLALCLSLVLSSLAPAGEPVAITGRAMGTTWSVKFVPPQTPLDHGSVQLSVSERLESLEQIFSTYRAESELSRFNAATHPDWLSVVPELARVAMLSREISELTGGAYDVTVGPLVRLWGFSSQRRTHSPPTSTEIATGRARVDWRRLEVQLDPPALRKTQPRVEADFSSMAKGFAADSVSELLTEVGANNHLVQVGGDVKSAGLGPGGSGWRTAIEEPVADARANACVIALRGEGLSTSGDYRNFFEAEGKRFGHIIDPRTGRPVSGELAAVSVVHRSAALSSAWATALFVLGADEGYRLARELNLRCLFQVRSGAKIIRRATPEFERMER